MYDSLIERISKRFDTRLSQIEGEFGFEYGNEFEIALCEILREVLPSKFGICRGYVVSAEGEKEGDDIIIYDAERFSTFKFLKPFDFSRKEIIPIEAFYAYIEAKHSIIINDFDHRSSIAKALTQVIKVKKLILKRKKTESNKHWTIGNMNFPEFSNPVFTMIIAKNVKLKGKSKILSPEEIDIHARSLYTKDDEKNAMCYPDSLILGKSNFMSMFKTIGEDVISTIFNINDSTPKYGVYKTDDTAFGMGLSHLLGAINMIELGTFPWIDIINEVIIEKQNKHEA